VTALTKKITIIISIIMKINIFIRPWYFYQMY